MTAPENNVPFYLLCLTIFSRVSVLDTSSFLLSSFLHRNILFCGYSVFSLVSIFFFLGWRFERLIGIV